MSYECNGDGDIYDDDGDYDEEYEEEAVENLEEWDDEDVDGPVYGRETTATPDSKSKQDEDPNEPRHYHSAFFLYTNAVRDEVKDKHPDVDFGTFVQERAKWEKLAQNDKARYEREIAMSEE